MRTGILILAGAVAIAAAIGWYQYEVEQTRQRGFMFGNDLQKIQDDVKSLQNGFYASIEAWDEGSIDKERLLKELGGHLAEFEDILARYDSLEPPEGFAGAVNLFRLSSQSQMESDRNYIEWLASGDQAYKTRSDLQLEESFDLEMAALAEFNLARDGPAP
ncbi:MAG: hypothetical protein J4G04_04455 [Nitrosopumilaceae archaeon]|nr:hypothetical protein [Nitrosopumilaceae archaeon]